MKAMILAAGFGTRLLPLTKTVPKPLIEVRNDPIVIHQIRALARCGIKEIVINVHHLAERIMSTLGSGEQFGVRITYSPEAELLDTGGGIVKALPLLGQSPFIVLNSDVWTDYPFESLLQRTTSHAHLVLKKCVDSFKNRDFDLISNRVRHYDNNKLHNYTYCGIILINPTIFERVSLTKFSLSRDLLFDLARDDKITGEVYTGTWFDIGSLERLRETRRFLASQPS